MKNKALDRVARGVKERHVHRGSPESAQPIRETQFEDDVVRDMQKEWISEDDSPQGGLGKVIEMDLDTTIALASADVADMAQRAPLITPGNALDAARGSWLEHEEEKRPPWAHYREAFCAAWLERVSGSRLDIEEVNHGHTVLSAVVHGDGHAQVFENFGLVGDARLDEKGQLVCKALKAGPRKTLARHIDETLEELGCPLSPDPEDTGTEEPEEQVDEDSLEFRAEVLFEALELDEVSPEAHEKVLQILGAFQEIDSGMYGQGDEEDLDQEDLDQEDLDQEDLDQEDLDQEDLDQEDLDR